VAFFENFIQIACLLFAWALVLLAFFLLAVQLFVTLIEFKLTTLAGFVLIPFGLFGKTAFMAERVLGNVVSSGIKVLVLAVIIGIGSTPFGQITAGFGGVTPTIDEAMAIVLAALSLLGLGIFGPGIATGLVSGGPQLGAGAAAATGAASTAYSLGSMGQTGAAGVASGLGGVARATGSAATSPLRRGAASASDAVKASHAAGARAGLAATGGASSLGSVTGASPAMSVPAGGPPAWARSMRRSQAMSHGVSAAIHALRAGDSPGSGASVSLSESDRS
ncbi:MAG: type IV secretion system protein, partial [Pseudomonadota bacterium]